MMGKRLAGIMMTGIMFSTICLFCVGFSTTASAGQSECSTLCKAGPKDYNQWSKWTCIYMTRASIYSSRRQEIDSSDCFLLMEGKEIDRAPKGLYEDFNQCHEQYCIPKMIEICGEEDRCAKPRNWKK